MKMEVGADMFSFFKRKKAEEGEGTVTRRYVVDRTAAAPAQEPASDADRYLEEFEQDLQKYSDPVLDSYVPREETGAPMPEEEPPSQRQPSHAAPAHPPATTLAAAVGPAFSAISASPADAEEERLHELTEPPAIQEVERQKQEELEARIAEKYRKELDEMAKMKAELGKALADKEKELNDKSKELAEKEKDLERLSERLAQRDHDLSDRERAFGEREDLLKVRQDDLKNTELLKHEQYDLLRQQINELLDKKMALEQDVIRLQADSSRLATEYGEKKKALDGLASLMEKREADILVRRTELDQFDKALHVKEEEILSRIRDLMLKEEHLKNDQTAFAAREKEFGELKEEAMADIVEAKDRLLEDAAASDARMQEASSALDAREKRISETEKRLAKDTETLAKERKKVEQAKELSYSLASLKKEIARLKREHDELNRYAKAKRDLGKREAEEKAFYGKLAEKEHALEAIEEKLLERKRDLDYREYFLFMKDRQKVTPLGAIKEESEEQALLDQKMPKKDEDWQTRLAKARAIVEKGDLEHARTAVAGLEDHLSTLSLSAEQKKDLYYEVLSLKYEIELLALA